MWFYMLRSKGGKRAAAAADSRDQPSTSGQKRKREKKIGRKNTENMSDNTVDGNRRANFSNVPSYGLNRNVNILNIKPAAKKIVIKNLKS